MSADFSLESLIAQGFKPARNLTGRVTRVVDAKVRPTMTDIHRAAAWWAGEGCVNATGGLRISIAQKETAVLYWLLERFGGSISKGGQLDGVSDWRASGPRARGFLMTIFSCIPESPRRRDQIETALRATQAVKKRGPAPFLRCMQGHPKQIGKDCSVCALAAQRIRRACPEAAERHRQEERDRYQRRIAA